MDPFGGGQAGAAPGAELAAEFGSPQAVGDVLFSDFLLPFEVTSILLLVAIVGAVVLSLRKGEREGVEEAP